MLSNDFEKFTKTLKKAKKEIAKQNFKKANTLNFDKIKLNLMFISNLPLLFLDKSVRIFLFMVLYTLQENNKNAVELDEIIIKLYSGKELNICLEMQKNNDSNDRFFFLIELVHQNDFDILYYVPNPLQLIIHFKDYQSIFKKIFKLSFGCQSLEHWLEFVSNEKCDKKISSILITCIDSSKLKAFPNDQKNILQTMTLVLKEKILKEPYSETNDPNEISGLRVSIKILLADEKADLKPSLKEYTETLLEKFVQVTIALISFLFNFFQTFYLIHTNFDLGM